MKQRIREFWNEWDYAVKFFTVFLIVDFLIIVVTHSVLLGLILFVGVALSAYNGASARRDFERVINKIVITRADGYCASAPPRWSYNERNRDDPDITPPIVFKID